MTLKAAVACYWESFPEEVTIELLSQEVGEEHSRQKEQHVKTIFFSFFSSFFDSCTGLILWPQFELDGSLYHHETNMTNLKIMASFLKKKQPDCIKRF